MLAGPTSTSEHAGARVQVMHSMCVRPMCTDSTKPNSRLYCSSKALAASPPRAGHGVMTGTSVPSYRRLRYRSTPIWSSLKPCELSEIRL